MPSQCKQRLIHLTRLQAIEIKHSNDNQYSNVDSSDATKSIDSGYIQIELLDNHSQIVWSLEDVSLFRYHISVFLIIKIE